MPRLLRILAVCVLAAASSSAAPMPAEILNPPEIVAADAIKNLPPHPRILVNAARWTELRARLHTDPATAEIFALLRARADAWLDAPPVNYTAEPHNILMAVREAQRRILTFALVYRLTDDPRYLAATRTVLDALVAQHWPSGHFLDVAEAAFTVSVAYDWLHADLTPAERETLAAKLHRAALVASVTGEDQNGWIWAEHNWNQVCNGGLALAALAIAERDPALSRRILNRSLAALPRAAAAYAPAGVYPEGPTYWNFGTTYHLLQLEAFRSALGTGHALEQFPGFLATAAFLDQVTGPTGDFFNYADNRADRGYSAAALWFARENRRPDLAAAELARIRAHAPRLPVEDSRDLPLALLWWQPLPDPVPAVTPAPLHWRGQSSQPLVSLRSSWDDPLATWLAIKGGSASHSHAHMDSGSFVLEALGVRWALDPVRDEYSLLRTAGYQQSDIFNYSRTSKRWAVFRLGPEGHNILRFDHAPQSVTGEAYVGPLVTAPDGAASVEINLASTYAGQAAGVRRTATLHPDASVTIADTWTALDRPTEVSVQWLTRATVTPAPDGLLLTEDGRSLHLRIQEIATVKIAIESVPALLNPKIDSPAPDLKRILIRQTTPAATPGTLTLHAIPGPRP